MGDDGLRAGIIGGFEIGEKRDECVDVVAVDFMHFPAERLELAGKRSARADVVDLAVDLQAVEVDDADKVAELLMGRERRGFPYLTLFAFTVTHQSEDAARKALQAQSGRKAGGDGETLAKRAGGHFDARAEIRIGMTLQTRTDLAQRLELLDGR